MGILDELGQATNVVNASLGLVTAPLSLLGAPLGMMGGTGQTGAAGTSGTLVPTSTQVATTQPVQQPAGGGVLDSVLTNPVQNFGPTAGLNIGMSLAGGVIDLLGETVTSVLGGNNAPQMPVGTPKLWTVVIAEYPNGYLQTRSKTRGTPKLMSKDVQTCKRVNRTVRKLDQRLPKKTVREGKSSQLTRAVMDKALASVLDGGGCCPR